MVRAGFQESGVDVDSVEQIPFKVLDPRQWPERHEHRIVKAAVRVGETVYIGWRHAVIMRHVTSQGAADYIDQDMQGFVDNLGNFHSRYMSAKIACRARQIRDIRLSTLLSEELWDEDGTPGNWYQWSAEGT